MCTLAETHLEHTAKEIKDKYENNQVKVTGKEPTLGAKPAQHTYCSPQSLGTWLVPVAKAGVHSGKALLAKTKLAEADIHSECGVIMERNIPTFREN